MNFDGILCEVFFNTFEEWKPTMYYFLISVSFMLIYPISNFFKKLFHGIKLEEKNDLRALFMAYIFTVI